MTLNNKFHTIEATMKDWYLNFFAFLVWFRKKKDQANNENIKQNEIRNI